MLTIFLWRGMAGVTVSEFLGYMDELYEAQVEQHTQAGPNARYVGMQLVDDYLATV